MAGYSTQSDGMQHVIFASKEGYVYHVPWDPSELAPGYHPPAVRLNEYFGDNMVTIAGFFTPDDQLYHAVVGTNDLKLYELYYNLGGTYISPNKRDLTAEYHLSSFDPSKGMAGFYSPGVNPPHDNMRHVVIVDSSGKLVDITWNQFNSAKGVPITIPPTSGQVASISGFLSTDDLYRHIIVARNDTGQIYDIAYPRDQAVPTDIRGLDNIYVKTTFGERVQNVTAFCSSDNNYRHIVVLTQANVLKYHAYDINGGNASSQLTSTALANIADITSFYNKRDSLRHVLYATKADSLYEITYTSQG